jgi:hypothetical protein
MFVAPLPAIEAPVAGLWARSALENQNTSGRGRPGFSKGKNLGSGVPGGRVPLCNRMKFAKFLGQKPDSECASGPGANSSARSEPATALEEERIALP